MPNRPPLVVVHGWGDSSQNYEEFLADGAWTTPRVCPDLPGFGLEPPPPCVWSSDDYAEWLSSWIYRQHFSRVDLLAHSFGGRLAVRLAVNRPDLVRKLVLMAPAGLPRQKRLPEAGLPGVMWETYRAILGEDLTLQISKIRQPVLVLWGDNDDRVPTHRSAEWLKLMPHARLEILKGNHWFHLIEAPSTAFRVEEFFANASDRP